jgi:phosphatidylserine/phosphatidylglycerophosphate/cardiolipin synthase-like enzyme
VISRRLGRWTFCALLAAVLTLVPAALSVATGSAVTLPVVNTWTEPSSGYGFLDAAIDAAHHSVDMSMYELSDVTVERNLVARAAAGVDVRVILDSDYEGKTQNASAYALLRASKVHVEWAPSDQIFHAKYLVIDGRRAYVGTGNLQSYYYASTRDFWVEVERASDVHAIVDTFNADFARSYTTSAAPGLVWSPGSTSVLTALIGTARHSLLVENEEMDSPSIESALAGAARRGVSVKVVMTDSSSWTLALEALARVGVHVRVLSGSQVYIHAKVICADCAGNVGTVFIGSENFSTSSLSYNRELGVVTTSSAVIRAVEAAVHSDFAQGSPVTAPTTSTNSGTLTVTSFESSISPGAKDSLSIHSPRANDSCDLTVTLPSGYTSESHGLGQARANASGNVTWTWEIGPSTDPGTARASITCGAGSVQRTFQIR